MSKESNKYNQYFNLEALAHLDLIMEDKEYWMTSLQLAEVSGRLHKNVLQDIERDLIIKKKIYENKIKEIKTEETNPVDNLRIGLKFQPYAKEILINAFDDIKVKKETYFNDRGTKDFYYKLNRNAALFCLARYNFITQVYVNKRFLDYVDKENEELKDKADKYNKTMESRGTFSVGTAAKIIKAKDKKGRLIGRNKLFELLRNFGLLQHEKGSHNIPYQNWIQNKLFEIVMKNNENGSISAVVRVTSLGIDTIINLLKEEGYMFEGDIEREMSSYLSSDENYKMRS